MTANDDNLMQTLGFLRIALLGFALLDIALPLADILFSIAAPGGEHNMWSVLTGVIAPVLAPLLLIVMLFDYIMSRVRATDADGALRARFITIGRIELVVIALSLLFWVPYFNFKLS